jgi:predicted lipid-binding transport protein (Tim44 family)
MNRIEVEFQEEKMEHPWAKRILLLFTFFFLVMYALEIDSFARVGSRMSSGSRGSRTYSAPRATAPSPTQPSGQYSQPEGSPMSQPMTQPQGGFLRGLAGGMIGGMLGGMLFRSLGFAGGMGGMGGGIGFIDIILIGLILYGIYWFIKKRRKGAESGVYTREAETRDSLQSSSASAYSKQVGDLGIGLSHVRQMDPSFDEKKFSDVSTDYFFRIQGAWANRDMASVRSLLTDEMSRILQGNADDLKSLRRINKLDNIAVRSADIVEAWQEEGRDFITVRFYANLLDYTIDEVTGQIVEGSKTDPVKFEEYWTFTRSVGNNAWQLSAITQPQ